MTQRQFGWLIEDANSSDDSPRYLAVGEDYAASFMWTKDNDKALRFCREQDAVNLNATFFNGAHVVAEHEWD